MEYSSYWKTFEQTGSVEDYLHYTACVREELAAGKADDEDVPYNGGDNVERILASENQAAMRAVIASSALATGVPASIEYGGIAGMPAVLGTSSAIAGALMSSQDENNLTGRKKGDENP